MVTSQQVSRGFQRLGLYAPTMLKRLLKVLGIVALTLAGLSFIAALHQTTIRERVPVWLGGDGVVYVNSWDGGYVHATGTWVIDGQRHDIPLNVSDIACFRDRELCYVASAEVTDIFGHMLDAYGAFHPIKRWDASTIEYTDDKLCVTYAYVIDRATQKLIGRRSKKEDAPDGECTRPLPADVGLSFVKGWDVVQQLKRERAPDTTMPIAVATAFVILMLVWAWRVIRKP